MTKRLLVKEFITNNYSISKKEKKKHAEAKSERVRSFNEEGGSNKTQRIISNLLNYIWW